LKPKHLGALKSIIMQVVVVVVVMVVVAAAAVVVVNRSEGCLERTLTTPRSLLFHCIYEVKRPSQTLC
jgi:hypothetical protein